MGLSRLFELLGLSGELDAGSDADAAHVGVDSHEYGSHRDRDDLLFAQPRGSCFGDCPLCFLPMPIDTSKHVVFSCCSKFICLGCFHAEEKRQRQLNGPKKCPFCRHPVPTTLAEGNANVTRRAEANDPAALVKVGDIHNHKGEYKRAFHYWRKAADLGDAWAHFNLFFLYQDGKGVEKDVKKEVHHLEEAAIAGHPTARYNLGVHEWNEGSNERAVKHYIIAANLGHDNSLKMLKKEAIVSKEDLAAALRAHQAAVDAMKSPQRDAAYAAEESRND